MFLHIGQGNHHIEWRSAQHVVDMGIVMGNLILPSLLLGALRNDITGTYQFYIRTGTKMGEVHI